MFDIDEALRRVVEGEGSDLHVKVPAPPMLRVHGELSPIPGAEALRPEDTERALHQIVQDPKILEEFERDGEADFSYQHEPRRSITAFRYGPSQAMNESPVPVGFRDDPASGPSS